MTLGTSVLVDRSDLHHTTVRRLAMTDDTTPPDGSVLLVVERFGLSALNVSYAVFGDPTGFWSYFPAPDGLGQIPVWGHATVLSSGHPDIAVGEEVYGFLPMATHLLIAPSAVDERGCTDGSAHRPSRASVYDRYLFRAVDPLVAATPDPQLEVLLRPTFTTSFLLMAELAETGYHGAEAVVFTSAGSRTAIGATHLLGERTGRPAVVGLSRRDHISDVSALGVYDRVLAYDEVESLPVGKTAVVDLAGDGALTASMHRHLGDSLVHSAVVGATHWEAPPVETSTLPGAPRTLFSAPETAARIQSRVGHARMEAALVAAWLGFAERMQDWLHLRTGRGPDAVVAAYRDVLRGVTSPRDGLVLSLRC